MKFPNTASFVHASLAALLFATPAFSFDYAQNLADSEFLMDPSERRLIQLSENEAPQWLSYEEIGKISIKSHAAGRCAGFMDVTDFPNKSIEARPFSAAFDLEKLVDPSFPELVEPLLPQLDPEKLLQSVTKLSSYPNRHYRSASGKQSAEWIRSEFVRIAGGRADITVEYFAHADNQPSVIARIAGKGPLKAERVILGAHQDSINVGIFGGGSANAEAPGADDDASGVATVLEVFRVIVENGFEPNRTIEFMAYAGEELGLLGSQAIAQAYKKANTPVAGVIQFDMTMFPGNLKTMHLITDRTHPELTKFVGKLVTQYVKVPFKETRCGYGCSDHASWNEAGYAAAFPFESTLNASNPSIHSKQDVVSKLDMLFGLNFAKLGLAYAIEMSAFPKP